MRRSKPRLDLLIHESKITCRCILSVDGWRVLNCTFKGFGAQTATEYEGPISLYQALEKIDIATMAKRTVYFRWS